MPWRAVMAVGAFCGPLGEVVSEWRIDGVSRGIESSDHALW
jgi:hypothetical protein